jgi:hypothetical protein
MDVLVIVVIVLATVGLGFALWRVSHPEDISGHADRVEPDSRSERLYGYSERPAGPDAEGMGVADPGDIVSGGQADQSGPEDR